MRSLAGLGGGLRGMPPSCWGPWAMEGVQAFRCPFLPPCFAQCVCVSPPPAKKQGEVRGRKSIAGGGGGQPKPPLSLTPSPGLHPTLHGSSATPSPAAGVTLVPTLHPVWSLGGGDTHPPPGSQFTLGNEEVQALGCPFPPPCFAQGPPPWLKSNKEKYEAEGVLRGG